MGDYLGPINLGTGIEVELCFDYSPTFSPSELSPTLNPTPYQQSSCFSRFSFGYFSCILSDGFQIKCWGHNFNGKLGYGDSNNIGDDSDEMGDNLPFIDLDDDSASFSVGVVSSCSILMSNLFIKCWGENISGQLGYGDVEARGDESGEMGSSLDVVSIGEGIIPSQITVGSAHSTIISQSGFMKSWGDNFV